MMKIVNTLSEFGKFLFDLLASDRDVIIGTSGFTGEGKTTFDIQLLKEYSKHAPHPWSFEHMTWSRKELMLWIDGEKDSQKVDGLKKHQLPEYSAILADELFKMFYRRMWFEGGQIDSIATLNMCRDRHLLILGNIPDFWDLDGAFTSRIRFFIYVPERGVAWVFEQENNPFTRDKWNSSDNKKLFRKNRKPYNCPNFICELHYDDITAEEKAEYLAIRNKKRIDAITDNRSERKERYGQIKQQRDWAVRTLYSKVPELNIKYLAENLDCTYETARDMVQGVIRDRKTDLQED